MNKSIDRINEQVERMQASVSLRRCWPVADGDASDVAMLQMAARLQALRPGAATPDEGFIARLRVQMLVEADGR